MSLQILINRMRDAREKATQGEWGYELLHGMGETWPVLLSTCGRVLPMTGDSSKETFESKFNADAEFVTLSANEILKLIRVAEYMRQTLFNISSGRGKADQHKQECKYALSKVDQICEAKP